MKERPIIFSSPMVRAILADHKTQTRRIIVWNRKHDEDDGCVLLEVNQQGEKTPGRFWPWAIHDGDEDPIVCPYGVPGDWLWVRETWWHNDSIPGRDGICYRADGEMPSYMDGEPWRPSIHMPRWASRILLEVESVRVERLQEISEADAVDEGYAGTGLGTLISADEIDSARETFAQEWDSLNAKRGYGWDTNPWVWVVTFRVLNPEEAKL